MPDIPKTVAITWGPDQEDALAVAGHGHAPELLKEACEREYGPDSEYRTATEYWICAVPDQTGHFSMRWVVVESSNRRAKPWTILQ